MLASVTIALNAAAWTFRDRPIPDSPLLHGPKSLSKSMVQFLGLTVVYRCWSFVDRQQTPEQPEAFVVLQLFPIPSMLGLEPRLQSL